MPNYPETGASVVIDHDQYNRDVDDIISRAGDVDAALNNLGGTIEVDVSVDDSGVADLMEIEGLDPQVSIEATIEDTTDIDELESLDGASFDPGINPELDDAPIQEVTDLDGAEFDPGINPELDEAPITEVTDLDGTSVEPEINPQETDEGAAVMDRLDQIRNLQIIDIAINIAGTVLDFVKAWQEFTVGPLLDVDQAASSISAHTGDMVTDWNTLINDLWSADLGDVNVVAQVLEAAQQIGAPLDEASRAALTFTHAFTDQNPVDVLNTLNQMVESGLAPNFEAAGNMLTVGFQNGGNRGRDLLGVLNDNSTMLSDMGLVGEEALSLITSGLDAGFASAGDVAVALTTMKRNLTEAAQNPDNPINDILADLGLDNPIAKGEEIGAEFLEGLLAGLNEAPDGAELAGDIFGKQGVKNVSAILGLDTTTSPFQDIIDASEEAATEMDNNLRGAIDDFVLAAQVAAVDFLSSEQIDLPGKIDAIKEGLQEALEIMAEGGTVGEAIEVGLNIPGFADAVSRFESGVGHFMIGALQLIAVVQGFLGQDNSATVAELGRLVTQQLTFDLQVANEDEIADTIQAAMGRGLTSEGAGLAIDTAINEAIANGDYSQAMDIVNGLVAGGAGEAGEAVASRVATQLQTAWTDAMAAGDFDLAGSIAAGMEDDSRLSQSFWGAIMAGDFSAAELIAADMEGNAALLTQAFNDAFTHGAAGLALDIATDLDDPEMIAQAQALAAAYQAEFDAAIAAGDTATAGRLAEQLDDDALREQVTALQEQVAEASTAVSESSDEMAGAVEDADARITAATTENTITTSFGAVRLSAEENFPIVIQWVDDTATALEGLDDSAAVLTNVAGVLASLAAAVESFPQAQLDAINASASGFAGAQAALAGGDTTYNTTVNNNNTNNAQAAAGTYDIGRALGAA